MICIYCAPPKPSPAPSPGKGWGYDKRTLKKRRKLKKGNKFLGVQDAFISEVVVCGY